MSKPSQQELTEFEADCEAWFAGNTVADPGFMLPLTFMEVSNDEQFCATGSARFTRRAI
jgi:hypothetical protein